MAAVDVALRVVTMLNEVEAGVRPPRVLWPLFDLHLRGAVLRAHVRPGPVARVHRLLAAPTTDDAIDVVAVCRRRTRYVAVGLRLSRRQAGWVVTDVAHAGIATRPAVHMSDPTCADPIAAQAGG